MLHLISDSLVELVEKHSDIIVKRWTKQLFDDPSTSSFTKENLKYVEGKARNILKQLGTWVSYDTTKDEVGHLFANEGIEYFKMGIPLCEVIRAVFVLRRTLWLFVQNESVLNSSFELHQMTELSDRVILFFDRSEYYIIRGYTEEMNRKITELWKIDSKETEKIFFQRSFYHK
jgi:hypothetical protein